MKAEAKAAPQSGRLLAEALRHLEQNGAPLSGSDAIEQHIAQGSGGIEQRIIERARQLAGEAKIHAHLQRVRHIARLCLYGALLLALLLGALASLQAFDQGRAVVNFYWLLLVLLGFNLVSLLFWLVGLWASNTPAASTLGQSAAWLVRRWAGSGPSGTGGQVANAWLGVMLQGRIGRWSLSTLGHGLWAGYLLGGLAMILLLLSARQYDFVWETTLLGEHAFVPLTQALAWLPAQLGLATPSLEQIQQSRLGADSALLANARQAWAALLIACLVLYGLAPRLVLAALCRLLQRRALQQFRLDTSRAYYVHLRQRLVPITSSIGIVDSDDQALGESSESATLPAQQSPPTDTPWLGIELDANTPWPPLSIDQNHDLGCVNDRADQHRALSQVGKLGPMVLAVAMGRSPDRGLARFIGDIVSSRTAETWLVLLDSNAELPSLRGKQDARMVDWYRLAARCGVDADRVCRLHTSSGAAP